MDTFIARQPVFNKNMKIFGYELLFRGGAGDKGYTGQNADQASSRVVMESFNSMGVENITGGKPAFINFTANLLLQNIVTLFPKEQLVIEILEDVEPTPELVEVCRKLHEDGYTLALDDFVYRPELDQLVEISRIIKFDFLACTPKEITDMIKKMNLKGKLLLAEKIETTEMFNLAAALGFTLFQGYFFAKPVTVATKNLSPLKISYIRLLKEVNERENMDFNRLAEVICYDVALSYKLLRLVNSAYYGLRSEVTDMLRALTLLGTREIQKWIFLISVVGISSDKPDELIKMSMIRGHFMETLNKRLRLRHSSEDVFLFGLFSMLDVLMGMPMQSALEGTYIAKSVHDALVYHTGRICDMLDLVISLEQSGWEKADRLAASMGADARIVSEEYLDAVRWCNELQL